MIELQDGFLDCRQLRHHEKPIQQARTGNRKIWRSPADGASRRESSAEKAASQILGILAPSCCNLLVGKPQRGNPATKPDAIPAQARKTLRRQFKENYDAKKVGNSERAAAIQSARAKHSCKTRVTDRKTTDRKLDFQGDRIWEGFAHSRRHLSPATHPEPRNRRARRHDARTRLSENTLKRREPAIKTPSFATTPEASRSPAPTRTAPPPIDRFAADRPRNCGAPWSKSGLHLNYDVKPPVAA